MTAAALQTAQDELVRICKPVVTKSKPKVDPPKEEKADAKPESTEPAKEAEANETEVGVLSWE